MDRVQSKVTAAAASIAEGRNFAHINPYAVERDVLRMQQEFLGPPCLGALRHPVREAGVPGPDITDIETAIRIVDERVGLVSSLKCRVPENRTLQTLEKNRKKLSMIQNLTLKERQNLKLVVNHNQVIAELAALSNEINSSLLAHLYGVDYTKRHAKPFGHSEIFSVQDDNRRSINCE